MQAVFANGNRDLPAVEIASFTNCYTAPSEWLNWKNMTTGRLTSYFCAKYTVWDLW